MYFVGVDGGTGDTEGVVMDRSGRVVGTGHGGPTNDPEVVGRMHPNVGEHLVRAIGQALEQAGLSAGDLTAVSLNLSGDKQALTEENARAWLAPLGVPERCPLAVEDDGLSAWAAGGFPDPAIWVLLGTNCGSGGMLGGRIVEHPLDRLDLDAHQGELVGAARIGTLALSSALHAGLGGRPTRLLHAFSESLAAPDLDRLIRWAREHVSADERADLCRVAAEVADTGDALARELFQRAGDVIGRATVAMARHMGVADRPVAILLTGKVWKAGDVLLESFRRSTMSGISKGEIRMNDISQARGAALLAMRHAGVEPDSGVFTAARTSN